MRKANVLDFAALSKCRTAWIDVPKTNSGTSQPNGKKQVRCSRQSRQWAVLPVAQGVCDTEQWWRDLTLRLDGADSTSHVRLESRHSCDLRLLQMLQPARDEVIARCW